MNQELEPENISRKKAFTTIIIFLFCLFGMVFVLSKYFNLKDILPASSTNNSNNINSKVTLDNLVDIDSYTNIKNSANDDDGDGVPNWKEVAQNTDPYDVESFKSEVYDKNYLEPALNKDSNFTSIISRDVYLASKYTKQDKNISPDIVASAAYANLEELLLPQRVQPKTVATKFTDKNLNDYGIIMSLFFSAVSSSDLVELREVKSNNDFVGTKIFYKKMIEVCSLAKDLQDIPNTFSDLHSSFIYNCESYRNVLSAISGGISDSVKLATALSMHQKIIASTAKNLDDYTSKFLNGNKVTFDIKKYPSTQIYYLKK